MEKVNEQTVEASFSFDRKKGFSLLELMLAIAIMSVMAIYGVYALRNWLRIQDINKTVLDMQHLLAASIQYHNQYGFWPTYFYDLVKAKLVEEEALCSPWPYTSSSASCSDPSSMSCELLAKLVLMGPPRACPDKAPYLLEISNMTTTGTRAAGAYMVAGIAVESEALAGEIAAKLPFGVNNGNTAATFTAANYAPPTKWAWGGDHVGWMTGGGLTGELDPNSQYNSSTTDTILGEMKLPACPFGFEGHVIVAPQFFMTDYDDYGTSGKANWMIAYPGRSLGTVQKKSGTSYYTEFITTTNPNGAVTKGNGGIEDPYETFLSTGTFGGNPAFLPQDASQGQYKQAYYFTFCVPAGSWVVNTPVSSYGAAQCVSSTYTNWGDYNATPLCP